MKWRVETLIAAGFGGALLILLAVSIVAYRTTAGFIVNAGQVTRSWEVLDRLDDVVSLLKDVETAERGYTITGEERDFQPYYSAIVPLQESTEQLQRLIGDNPGQQKRLSILSSLIGSLLGNSKQIVETRNAKGLAAAAQLVMSAERQDLIEKTKDFVGMMIREERMLLRRRNDAAEISAETSLWVIRGGSILALLTFALASVFIHRNLQERWRAEMALRRAHDELEARVRERTEALANANVALRDSEARLRQIIDLAPVYIYAKDPKGRFLLANRLTAEAFGHTPREVEGKTYEELSPEIFEGESREAELEILASGKAEINPEEVFVSRPGFTRVLQTARIPFTTLGSSERAVLGVSIDITERILAEKRLRESEASLAAAQRLAHLGSWEVDLSSAGDATQNTPRLSAEAFRIFGHEPGAVEFTNKSLFLAVHPDDRAAVSAAVAEAIREKKKYHLDHRIVLPGGQVRVLHAESDIVYGEDGSAVRMVGTFQDITERKQAEQEIRQLNDELEQRVRDRTAQLEAAVQELEAFSYSVSHDLRAPLRAIDGFSNFLLEDYSDRLDDHAKNHLTRIRNATQRMGAIIDDLLRLSRVTRADLSPCRLSLSHMAEEVVTEFRAEHAERAVRFKIAPGLDAVADPDLMRIVVENLLRNAWKFTSKHPQADIEFGGETRDGERVFYVRDDGAGFDMKFAAKLFRPFERLHGNNEFEGTGIGLAIVGRIIQRHGGRIWAQGAIEKGATFFFTLPS
jgi:PAS domain S-box-containing protein